jgi:hypothetical protein
MRRSKGPLVSLYPGAAPVGPSPSPPRPRRRRTPLTTQTTSSSQRAEENPSRSLPPGKASAWQHAGGIAARKVTHATRLVVRFGRSRSPVSDPRPPHFRTLAPGPQRAPDVRGGHGDIGLPVARRDTAPPTRRTAASTCPLDLDQLRTEQGVWP